MMLLSNGNAEYSTLIMIDVLNSGANINTSLYYIEILFISI